MTHMTYYWTPQHDLPHILTTLAHVFRKTLEQKDNSGNDSISYIKGVDKGSQIVQTLHRAVCNLKHATCYNAPKAKPTH